MNREYQWRKDYSAREVLRYVMRKWWLTALCAVLCAAVIGGYKYKHTYRDIDEVQYRYIDQVAVALYVGPYSDGAAAERVNTIMKIADSWSAYERYLEITGSDMSYAAYQELFECYAGDTADVMLLYVDYAATYDGVTIANEDDALAFASGVAEATIEVTDELLGDGSVSILDAPYAAATVQDVTDYSITRKEFYQGVAKALVAGFLLGLILELVIYICWLLLNGHVKNAEEIRLCLDVPVIDRVRVRTKEKEAFREAALFLQNCEGKSGEASKYSPDASIDGGMENENICKSLTIACIPLNAPYKDAAYRLAERYADAGKKTLFVDLAAGAADANQLGSGQARDGELAGKTASGNRTSNGQDAGCINGYVLSGGDMPKPISQGGCLDLVFGGNIAAGRNVVSANGGGASASRGILDENVTEENMAKSATGHPDIVLNSRLEQYIQEMSSRYACIVMNAPDAEESADAYAAAKLCDRVLVICGRKHLGYEPLYRMKNTMAVNGINADGILVYE